MKSMLNNLSIPQMAYLDPGTGSMVIQMVAAAIFGSMAVLGMFWARIKAFLGSLLGKKAAKEGSDD